MRVCSPITVMPGRHLRGLMLVGIVCASSVSTSRAEDKNLRDLARTLASIESDPAGTRVEAESAAVPALGDLPEALVGLERRDAARRREFAAAAARRLPPRAAQRLERTRAAYEAGHARLIALVRALAARSRGPARGTRGDGALAREAREIVEKLLEASRREPLSTGDLKVRPPALTPPPLDAPAATAALHATATATAADTPVGAVPQILREAAATLTGPVEVYEWVRNNTRPEFYHGAMKGAVETYLERSGNDADTASLLVEMLRAKGVPARYVRGAAVLPAATLRAMTGTVTPELAVRVLDRAGIPHDPPVLGGGTIASVRVARVWVEAYVPYANYRGTPLDAQGKLWVPLDPAFKRLPAPRGLDVVRDLGFDARSTLDAYFAGPTNQTPLDQARAHVMQLLAQQRPDLAYADVVNNRDHLAESLGILPPTTPYAAAPIEVAYGIPDSLRHTVRFVGDAAGTTVLDATVPVSDLIGRRVTLSYVPASDEDGEVARGYGGMLKTPPYLIEVKPVLKVGGVGVVAGDAGVGMGVRYTLRIELHTPGGTETVANQVLAGNLTAIGLGGRSISQAEEPAGVAAQILSGLASSYLDRWNSSDDELSRLLHVVPVRPTVSECMVMSDMEVEYAGGDPSYPLTFDWKGIAIDADLRSSAPVGVEDPDTERHFLMLSGLEGSVLEHRTFEDDLQIDSVSTTKALQLAAPQGVALVDVSRDNVDSVLPGLALDAGVKEEIREAAARGLLARVPASPVTRLAWTGVGYLLLDEEAGEAAYQLQGGHSGGVTAPAVIDIPRNIVDPLTQQGEDIPPAPEDAEVAHVQKFVSTDLQEATVGATLSKPLKVRVSDVEGHLIRAANVIFTVIGGEGLLMDPVDRTFKSEVVVRSDDRGEASATLRVGTNTGLIPRFTCLTERWDCTQENRYLTQVGLNLVTARAGAITLSEPFTGVGFPDDKFDGQRMTAQLEMASTASPTAWYNLSVADRVMVAARDPYRNPISNFPIRFAFRPPPVPDAPPPGASVLNGPTGTPGKLLRPKDYEACLSLTPSPAWGQCAGEADVILQQTSSIGAFGYMVIGDSAYSGYIFDIGTDIQQDLFEVTYHTHGLLCFNPNPASCGAKPSPPVVMYGARARLLNRLGNMIEAYPVGGDAQAQFFAYAMSEIEQINKEVDDQGQAHYHAVRTNRWRREPLTNSEFRLTPQTPGTGVSPPMAPHVGGGTYAASMVMGATPQLNTIAYAGTHLALVIPYLRNRPDDVDPAYVTDNGLDPPTVMRVPGPPQQGPGDFGLWGVALALTDVTPFPIVLDAGNAVARPSRVQQQILPESFRRLLDPLDVLFEVKQDGKPVVAATGLGDFEVPRGLAFPPGVHSAHLQVLRASSQDVGIAAVPRPLDACSLLALSRDRILLSVTRDPSNGGVLCADEGRLPFVLCRPARVTLKVDGLSVVENLDMAAGEQALLLPPTLLGLDPNASAPFELRVVDRADPSLQTVATGTVESSIVNRSVLPVGHTFVKGVDILDGHLVQQGTDFKVPGRHLGLEMTRTYSSAGRSPAGVMGAGWALSYASALHVAECAVIVTTADGSSQAFSSSDGGNTFRPQKGYHTSLVKNSDGSYDFVDKSHTRHHFRAPIDPLDPRPERDRRLEYIEETHGDRLVFIYDEEGRLLRVAERHPEAGDVRSLALTYERKSGFDRITKADIAALDLRVDYGYDAEGNLISVNRSGRNVDGPDAPDRVETYKYSIADDTDRHQMLERTDANGSRTAYEYYLRGDTFPGEAATSGGVRAALQKQEYVKRVREFPDGSSAPRTFETRFTYDISEIEQARLKPTVTDARGNDTRYVLNGNGSPLRIEEPFEAGTRTTTIEWSATDIFKTREIDPLGRITSYGYDANGNLTSERIATTDLGEVETTYGYDPTYNKLTFKKDAEGRETRYEIDPDTGDLVLTTDAVGNRTRYEYDPLHGLLLSITDPRNHVTRHASHDSFGNPRLVTDPLGNQTVRDYDLRGRLKEHSDTLGHHATTLYDGLDRPREEKRFVTVSGDAVAPSDDAVTRTEYYPGGQPRAVTNPNGAVTRYQLDGLNRVVLTEMQVEGGPYLTQAVYDGNGNKISETDRQGVTRLHRYDKLNRRREVTIAPGSAGGGPYARIAAYDYDLVGNEVAETNMAGDTTTFVHDGLYHVKERFLPERDSAGRPYKETFVHDKVGNRLSATDANAHAASFAYDGLNRIVRTTNALSQVVRVEYNDPEGSHVNKSLERDETRGLATLYRHDERNREVERRVQFLNPLDGSSTEYLTTTSYDDPGHRLTVTDPRSIRTLTRLDGMDRVIETLVDVGGRDLSTQTAYDGMGNRKTVRDPNLNRATVWEYDGLGRQVRMTDALGNSSSATYDGEGVKLTETDRRGITKLFSYDSLVRPALTRVPATIAGSKPWSHEIRYFELAHRREEYDARGTRTTFDLDKLGRVVRIRDLYDKTVETTYDGVGNKLTEKDKRGFVTHFEYDPLNRLILVRDPLEQTIETSFDDSQNRRVEKDKRLISRLTQADALGRVVRVVRPYDRVKDEGIPLETHAYDGDNNRLSSTDADGKVTGFEYDRANRVRRRVDGQGSPVEAATVFIYDANGNKTTEIDPRSTPEEPSMRYAYDELNRLTDTTDGESDTTTYGYDREGNRASVQEPKGEMTRFDYDELGKLIRVTQPRPDPDQPSPVTSYEYDENRNRVRQTDGNGHVVSMTYDRLDRMTRMAQDPDGLNLVTQHEYDESGNERSLMDAKGQTVTSTYDPLDRLKTKAYAFAPADTVRPWRHTTSIAYTYDANNNLKQVDERVASGNDPPSTTLTTLRDYDDLDRLQSETNPLPDGGNRTASFTYHRNGTRETLTDPAGLVTRYTYDGQNRLESLTIPSPPGLTTYSYYPDDLLRTVTYPNGVVGTHAYDKADRLTSLANTNGLASVSSYVYTYDSNGNRLTQLETNGSAETTAYSYDDLNRLRTVTYPVDASFPGGRMVTYGYDPVGNRIRETETDSGGSLLADKQGVFDNINRLTALNDLHTPANSTLFAWDANGNQISKTVGSGSSALTTTYRHDVRDKMVETEQGDAILGRFQYDFEGRRTNKIGEEGVRQYVYDQTSILLEYDESGGQVARYDYGSDRLVSLVRRDEPRRFYSLDGLRSVVNLTDESGSPVARYHLDAWGNFRFPNELIASKNRFAFTGYEWDPEIGLFNAKARYFDPPLGRFLSQDSYLGQVDDPPSLHRYFYANANPVRYIDPTGHQAQSVAPEVDEKDAILREAKAALETVEKANPQLTGGGDEAARHSNEPVIVDEDHGVLGNVIVGAARWLGETWLGRKVRAGHTHVADQLEAAAKKTGTAASGFVHIQAAEQDPVRLASKADAATSLQGEYSQAIAQTNIGKGFEDVAADVAREGAERGTREALPTLIAAGIARATGAVRAGLGDVATSPALADLRAGVVSHLERFREGGSFLMPESAYNKFVKGQRHIGMPGGQFIVPSESMDRILKASGGSRDYVKKALGIPADVWNEPLVRIDIGNPLLHNVRMPTGLEPGANPMFRAGGYTSGGIPEAVVGRVPQADVLAHGVVKLK